MKKFIFKILSILVVLLLFSSIIFAKRYAEERVNLVFKDADLKNVLMLFAEYENKNFIIDEGVKGKITIRLKNVPWQQALQLILDMKNLVKIEKGNVVRIVTREYIKKRELERINFLKKKELEKINEKKRKKELTPLSTEILYINFAKASDIGKKLKQMLTKRGKIITDTRTNSLIITDIPKVLKKCKKVVKVLDKPTPQVVIEAKIVIVTNAIDKELGIQWGGSFIHRIKSNDFFYGINGYSSIKTDTGIPNITNIVPPAKEPSQENYLSVPVPSNYVVNAPTVQPPVGGIGLIFGKWGYYNLAFKLSALKTKNLVKEISSPKVIALDNEKAVIGQGQEIPYKTVSDSGTKTEFKDAKLKLEVTPHITSNNMILLDIFLTKDSKGEDTPDGPAINTQEIQTKLLLHNGETAVIGGIISKIESKMQSAVPFFSDIPIFGALFKNNINNKKKGELLIFITPNIVTSPNVGKKTIQIIQESSNSNVGIITKDLTMFKRHSISSKKIARLKKNQKVLIINKSEAPWYYVSFKNKKGWIFKYIKLEK